MGIVVNKSKAFKECTCYYLPGRGNSKDPENVLCYSSGVRGALSNLQDLKCNRKKTEFLAPSAEFADHMEHFGQVSKDCSIDLENPNTYSVGSRTFKVKDLVSRSKCILAKLE